MCTKVVRAERQIQMNFRFYCANHKADVLESGYAILILYVLSQAYIYHFACQCAWFVYGIMRLHGMLMMSDRPCV